MSAADLVQAALAHQKNGEHEKALAGFDAALALTPDDAEIQASRANTLAILGRHDDALAGYARVLALRPDAAAAYFYRGHTLAAMGRTAAALNDYQRACMLAPAFLPAFIAAGKMLEALNQPGAALGAYQRALELQPGSAEALFHRGNALAALEHFAGAVESYDFALTRTAEQANIRNNRAMALQRLSRFGEAMADYRLVMADAPDHRQALGGLANAALHACDWRGRDEMLAQMRARIADSSADIAMGTLQGYTGDPALLLENARGIQARRLLKLPPPLWRGKPFSGPKIKLAYCSADFNRHATAHLMAEVFERHDRNSFEVIAIDFSRDDASPERARLVKAFDQFHVVRADSDAAIAARMADMGVDIAVDLKGFTSEARLGIFSARPAPVQVNYLGYPGTMGAEYMDYILGDPIVTPPEHNPFYSEAIMALPDCYQPNVSARDEDAVPSRGQAGLPETGLVFCCFNNNWKIGPQMFAAWMRLLAAVPGSVLWLLEDNAEAAANLRREAAAQGIGAERLVFAPRVTARAHMARHGHADLFLDTLPYNAHTTASDSMWAGVPLVTCLGESFAGRVGASIVTAMGVPELVTKSLADYEALALALALDPARLAALKQKMRDARASQPLFDTVRFTRNLEAAYRTMRDTWLATPRP